MSLRSNSRSARDSTRARAYTHIHRQSLCAKLFLKSSLDMDGVHFWSRFLHEVARLSYAFQSFALPFQTHVAMEIVAVSVSAMLVSLSFTLFQAGALALAVSGCIAVQDLDLSAPVVQWDFTDGSSVASSQRCGQ
eukprot:3791645-Amphidinium_carterae.1